MFSLSPYFNILIRFFNQVSNFELSNWGEFRRAIITPDRNVSFPRLEFTICRLYCVKFQQIEDYYVYNLFYKAVSFKKYESKAEANEEHIKCCINNGELFLGKK